MAIHYKEDNIYNIHEYNIDIKTHELYLFGEEIYMTGTGDEVAAEQGVEYTMANKFIRNLNILSRKSTGNILIHMKTCGGDWHEGMAIYDAIKACPNFVTIINYTHARSMSSLIFLAADFRVMMPHSTYMYHEGTFGTSGTTKQARTELTELQKSNDQMIEIYVDHLKTKGNKKSWSKKRIRKWLVDQMNQYEEVYLSAEDAVKHGFANEVFTEMKNYIEVLP